MSDCTKITIMPVHSKTFMARMHNLHCTSKRTIFCYMSFDLDFRCAWNDVEWHCWQNIGQQCRSTAYVWT